MFRGGALSFGLHALVVGAVILDVAFFDGSKPLEAPPVIPVELTTIGPETNQAVAGEKDPEQAPVEQATAPDPEPAEPPKVAAPEPEPQPPAPLPDTNALVTETPQPEPEPERAAEETPPAPPVVAERPEPVKQELHPDATIAAKSRVDDEETKLAALEPLPKPEPEPEPEKKPEPEVKKEPEPEPKPEPRVAEPERPRPPQPPKPKQKTLDLDRLTAKLDKLADDTPRRPRDEDRRDLSKIKIGEGGVSQNRLNPKLSVTEVDLLRSRLRENWSPNHGAPGVERMQVVIRINLNRDGTLARDPDVIEGYDAGQSSEVFQAFSESAIRAVRKSQPFPLPPDKYEDWREIEINFNLREMYG